MIRWAFGLCLPPRWPRGVLRPSDPVAEPAAVDEPPPAPLVLAEPAPPQALGPGAPVPQIVHPPRLAPDQVIVKLLTFSGKPLFFTALTDPAEFLRVNLFSAG